MQIGGQLGGGAPTSRTTTITARARDLGMPVLRFSTLPAPPLSSELAPPGGETWARAVASGRADGSRMLSLAMTAMWQTALLAPYDRYLGNPDPNGPSKTSYRYVLAPPVPVGPSGRALPSGVKPLGVVWFALVALALLFGLTLAWARA